jgi:hypothetical protein
MQIHQFACKFGFAWTYTLIGSVEATGGPLCLRQREGQTTHYGLRKILHCAANKATLFTQWLGKEGNFRPSLTAEGKVVTLR